MKSSKPFSHDEFPDLTRAISEIVKTNPPLRPLPQSAGKHPKERKGRVIHMDGWRGGKMDGKPQRVREDVQTPERRRETNAQLTRAYEREDRADAAKTRTVSRVDSKRKPSARDAKRVGAVHGAARRAVAHRDRVEKRVFGERGSKKLYGAGGRVVEGVDEACWRGYTAKGTKRKGDRVVPDCVKEGEVRESHPHERLAQMGAGELRKLAQKYRKKAAGGNANAGRELADIEGLLGEASACERAATARLKSANAADLKEYPGKRGEAAHKRLHKTIKKVVDESLSAGEIGKRLEAGRAAQRPAIRAKLKAGLKAKHKPGPTPDEVYQRGSKRYREGPAQGWAGD